MDVWGKENIPSGVFLKLLKLRCGSGGDSSIKATPHFPPFLSQDKHNKCYLRAEFFFFLFFFIRGAWLLSDKPGSHLHRLCPRIIYHLLPLRACLGAVVAQP